MSKVWELTFTRNGHKTVTWTHGANSLRSVLSDYRALGHTLVRGRVIMLPADTTVVKVDLSLLR